MKSLIVSHLTEHHSKAQNMIYAVEFDVLKAIYLVSYWLFVTLVPLALILLLLQYKSLFWLVLLLAIALEAFLAVKSSPPKEPKKEQKKKSKKI